MTRFNISLKQLKLNRWVPSYKKRKFYKKIKKTTCYECRKYGYAGYGVEWDKIQEGDTSKKRCHLCRSCLAKNCCRECGSDYTDTGDFKISEEGCGHCHYLDKWGPNGYEYLELRDEYESDEEEDDKCSVCSRPLETGERCYECVNGGIF